MISKRILQTAKESPYIYGSRLIPLISLPRRYFRYFKVFRDHGKHCRNKNNSTALTESGDQRPVKWAPLSPRGTRPYPSIPATPAHPSRTAAPARFTGRFALAEFRENFSSGQASRRMHTRCVATPIRGRSDAEETAGSLEWRLSETSLTAMIV